MSGSWYVEIRRYAEGDEVDDEVVRRLGPFATEKKAEKIEDGANRNLDHLRYYTQLEYEVD